MGVEPACLQRTYSGEVYEYRSYAGCESGDERVVEGTGCGVTATGAVQRAGVYMCGGLAVQVSWRLLSRRVYI